MACVVSKEETGGSVILIAQLFHMDSRSIPYKMDHKMDRPIDTSKLMSFEYCTGHLLSHRLAARLAMSQKNASLRIRRQS
jgi:hypothetical protein